MKKKKLKLRKQVSYKLILLGLIGIILFLFSITYYIYTNSRKIEKYEKNSTHYSYLTIVEMSDAFAKVEDRELHFVRDNQNLYIIAINPKELSQYQSIIDYSYGKKKKSKEIKVYGYPVEVNQKIKQLSVKYINLFLSYENRIDINEKNFSTYFPNTYLDTTIKESYSFNYVVFLLFFFSFLLFLYFLSFIIKHKLKGREEVNDFTI